MDKIIILSYTENETRNKQLKMYEKTINGDIRHIV